MSDLFELDKIVSRVHFPGGPNADPGSRLLEGYLPGWTFGGSLMYAHVSEITPEGDVIPSPVDAVEETTGKVLCAGTIVIVDVAVKPPQVMKVVGRFLESGSLISYDPKPVL